MPFYFGVGKVSLALKQGLTQIRNVKSPAVSNPLAFFSSLTTALTAS